VDIDDVLSSIQQRSMLASASLNSGGMAVLVDNGTRGSSPTDSSCSTAGSNQGERLGSQICPGPLTHTTSNPIILSNNDCASAESETNCSDLDVDARSKSNSNPPYATDSELADGGGFSSEPPSFLIALLPTINTTITITTAEPTKPSFASANRPRPASLDLGFDIYQASKLQVNADLIQESTGYDGLDSAKELESKCFNIFAKEDEVDPRSMRGRTLPATSDMNLPSGNNISGL
jgi:hypothetical protein